MLFEIATDMPGFAVDEPVSSLGKSEAAAPVRAAAQGHRGDPPRPGGVAGSAIPKTSRSSALPGERRRRRHGLLQFASDERSRSIHSFTPDLISDDGTVSVESTEKFLRNFMVEFPTFIDSSRKVLQVLPEPLVRFGTDGRRKTTECTVEILRGVTLMAKQRNRDPTLSSRSPRIGGRGQS